ncbi:MAG: hypothetical protein PHU85_09075 [Phycisphaerae bacterium]|nr:hypothetical protein [Phycisphaerae bacterium]
MSRIHHLRWGACLVCALLLTSCANVSSPETETRAIAQLNAGQSYEEALAAVRGVCPAARFGGMVESQDFVAYPTIWLSDRGPWVLLEFKSYDENNQVESEQVAAFRVLKDAPFGAYLSDGNWEESPCKAHHTTAAKELRPGSLYSEYSGILIFIPQRWRFSGYTGVLEASRNGGGCLVLHPEKVTLDPPGSRQWKGRRYGLCEMRGAPNAEEFTITRTLLLSQAMRSVVVKGSGGKGDIPLCD